MQSFSRYLQEKYIRSVNKKQLKDYIQSWFFEIQQELITLKKFFPPYVLVHLCGNALHKNAYNILNQLSTLADQSSLEKLVEDVDTYYKNLLGFLNAESSSYLALNSRDVPVNFYPFSTKKSGVEMLCRIVNEGQIIVDGKKYHAESCLGATPAKAKEIKNRISSISKRETCHWLNDSLKRLRLNKKHIDIIDRSQPHAEDDWFIQFGQNILDIVKENESLLKNTTASDDLLITHLIGPRIEFVMSTSPCTSCQLYFKALRSALNELNIYIPIIIFADSHFNMGERDCTNYIVTFSGDYQMLPGQWKGPSLLSLTPQKTLPAINFNETYNTIITLNIFGEVFLPTLIRSKFAVISSFINALIDHETTNYIMLDWIKYYLSRILEALSYDFSKTQTQALMASESYKAVNLDFMRRSLFNKEIIKHVTPISSIAIKNNNALIFFISLFKQWSGLLYSLLGISQQVPLAEIKINGKLQDLINNTKRTTNWDLVSAPQELIHQIDFQGIKENYIRNEEALNFMRYVNLLSHYIHYINIDIKYQNQILNGTLTHPADSPLGQHNASYNHVEIAQLIYRTRRAIENLACKGGIWDMSVLEAIFEDFRNQKFHPRLLEEIKAIEPTTRHGDLSIERLFSQEQVISDSKPRCLVLVEDKKQCYEFPFEDLANEEITEEMKNEMIQTAINYVEQSKDSKKLSQKLICTQQNKENEQSLSQEKSSHYRSKSTDFSFWKKQHSSASHCNGLNEKESSRTRSLSL